MTQAHKPKYTVSGHWDGHGNDFYLVNQRDDKSVDEIAETARKIGHALNAHDDLVRALQERADYHKRYGYRSTQEEDLHQVELAALAAQVQP